MSSSGSQRKMPRIGEVNEAFPRQEENGSQENKNETENLVNRITRAVESLPDPLTLECCIYKIPNKIRQHNKSAYSPSVISIGPFHNGEKGLESMENLKLRYLKRFCERARDGLLRGYVRYLKQCEGRIRRSYAERIKPYDSDDFVKTILIDSCFIFELFIRSMSGDWSEEDLVLLKDWLKNSIAVDLTLLENQIPFFVLKDLYSMAYEGRLNDEAFPSPNFLELTNHIFSDLEVRSVDIAEIEHVKHFTDLTRLFYLLDQPLSRSGKLQRQVMADQLPSASKLDEAGFKFSARQDKVLAHLHFENGVLEMSLLKIYDFTEILVRNVMAFEQCHYPSEERYVTQFICLLDFLIDTSTDVDVLVQRGVILNALGDSNAVATMVNNLCKNFTVPIINSHYLEVCDDLCRVYKDRWQKWKAILKREYFGTPWKAAGSVAAVFLILLTLIQTICSLAEFIK